MAGFILGTGSGVLAAAAVYYTLSAHLTAETASLRTDLHSSSQLLDSSFNPSAPPAQSALIGPSSTFPPPPPFSQLLRQRWNDKIASFVGGVRQSDWESIGREVVQAGRGVVDRMSDSDTAKNAEKKLDNLVDTVKEKASDAIDQIKPSEKAPETKELTGALQGIDLHRDRVGTVGGVQEELRKRVAEAKGRMV